MMRMPLKLSSIDFGGLSSSWWDEINDSVQWQDGIFYTLCAAYALVSSVALIQLIRIELRVPEYGWTTQKVFHLMNFIVNGVRAIVFGFHKQVFYLNPKVLILVLLDLPGLLFFSTFTLLVLFWAEIYHQARSLPTDKLRIIYLSVNGGIYFIQVCIWISLWIDDSSVVEFVGKIFIAAVKITQTTKTTEATKLVDDKEHEGTVKDNLLINETITTKTEQTESGGTLFTRVKSKVEQVIHEFIPETLTNNHKVVESFDKLKESVSKNMKDKSINPEIEWDAEVRQSNELCDEEKKFLNERKEYIKEAFAKYVGVGVEEIHVDDIPVIAFAGSGGGFRAMIATTAYMRAVQDSGLYDCGTYFSGLSGSCWNLVTQYSSLCATKENPVQTLLDYFKEHLTHHIASPRGVLKALSSNSSPEKAVELVFGGLVEKEEAGIKLHVIDVYGCLLAARLLVGQDPESQHQDFKLSQQRRFIEGGKQMMPIYTAIYHERPWKDELDETQKSNVENYTQLWDDHSKKKDHMAWYEFTPFEIGCDEQAAWVPTWAFGRKFELGKNLDRLPEQNIGPLIGIMGAAPSAPIYIDIRQFEHFLPEGWLKTKWRNLYDGAMEDLGDLKKWKFEGQHLVPTADNNNYIHHLTPPPYKLGLTNYPILQLIDAGADNDLPLYPLVHPSRKVDIIIGFDCSSQIIKHEYFESEQKVFLGRKGINSKPRDVENKYCEIYDYIPTGQSDGYTTPAVHPSVFVYLPYLPNEKVDKDFVPSTAKFASFANFTYSSEQIDLMIRLAKQNWSEVEEKIKGVVIDTWKKKRDARLQGKK